MVDFRHRPMAAHVSVSELYHENSKLFPEMLSELTATFSHVDAIRREFVQRRAIVARATGTARFEVDQRYCDLLEGVARTIPLELFYAVELRVISGVLLAAYEPISNMLQVVKRLSPGDLDVLRHAMQLMNTSDAPFLTGAVLLILGSFARNDILFGPRGYRRTLLEAGRVAQAVVVNAEGQGLKARVIYEFIDRELDLLMEADGIEQGTLMVIELDGATHAV